MVGPQQGAVVFGDRGLVQCGKHDIIDVEVARILESFSALCCIRVTLLKGKTIAATGSSAADACVRIVFLLIMLLQRTVSLRSKSGRTTATIRSNGLAEHTAAIDTTTNVKIKDGQSCPRPGALR